MKRKCIAGLLIVCALAGCRDPGADIDSGTEQAWESEKSAETSAPVKELIPVKRLEKSLPGGISELPFQYHVKLDRDTGKSRAGHEVREVGIEFLESTHWELEAEVTRLLGDHGGAVEQRQASGKSLRIVYLLSDGTRMLAWYRPGPPPGERYALEQVGATGTLYLAWPYIVRDSQ